MTMLCFENANAVSELSLIIIINLPFERVLEMGGVGEEREETGPEFLDPSFSAVLKETCCCCRSARRTAERQRWIWEERSLQALVAPWQAQVNFVISLLMIVLAGKGGVGACSCVRATPANSKDRNCLISRILRGWRERRVAAADVQQWQLLLPWHFIRL